MGSPPHLPRCLAALALSLSTAFSLLLVVPEHARAATTARRAEAPDVTAGEAGTGLPAPDSRAGARTIRLSPGDAIHWSDVGRRHWARTAIDYVGERHGWMRDYKAERNGDYPFRPKAREPRKLFFRSAVRAFAPSVDPDPDTRFRDLERGSNFWRYASIAVKLDWTDAPRHRFRPEDPITMSMVHRALVLGVGLEREVAGLNGLHTRDGYRFHTPSSFGTTLLGLRIGLRRNHSNERMDVTPSSVLPRAEVAWSLYRAATVSSSTLTAMQNYRDIELPRMNRSKRRMVDFGIRYAGYPYVWGGEWHRRTPGGYCCGAQPVGGFDCSGLTWWLAKRASGGWDNTPPRSYRGWPLPERTSRDMAAARNRVSWSHRRPGDLLFYDGSGDGVVDHVDVYVGNGWALDSSSGVAGVTIMWVGTGWYRDHFVRARRIAS
jgi:cell wall-associated NlpC family hydrolase